MNLNEKQTREKYKVFYGRNVEQMELLIKDKRVPLTMKQIIERRLNSKQDDWRHNYFNTCDLIVQYKGKIKIVKSCDILKKMNKNTKLTNGGIKLSLKQYKELNGKEFDKSKLILNRWLTRKEADKHPIWKYLLGEHLLDYVKLIFFEEEKAMGVYIIDEELFARAWYVGRTGGRSDVVGWYDLDDGYGRFAGLASEMLDKKDTQSGEKEQ